MEQNTYNQLLDVNVTKGYKKAPPTTEEDITLQHKTIATKLELDDRIDVTAQKTSFHHTQRSQTKLPEQPNMQTH